MYFVNRHFFTPLVKDLFVVSGISSLVDHQEVATTSIHRNIVANFVIICLNIIVALSGFFLYTLIHLGLPKEVFQEAVENIAIISAFNIFFAVICGTMLGNHITNPLKSIEQSLKNIAQASGDLTKKAEILTMDETGRIASWFNTFLANMQKLVSEIRQASDNVTQVAETLSATSEEMNAGVEEVTAIAGTVADGASEQLKQINTVVKLSENIQNEAASVYDATQDAVQTIGVVVQSATEGQQKAKKSVESIGVLVEEANQTVLTIRDLSDKIAKIGSITDTIRAIGAQTNLLALNAAIESARAGAHGTGFSVIAQEVRKLNDNTTAAADNISKLIAVISQTTRQAIDQVQRLSTEVNNGKTAIEMSNKILGDIADDVDSASIAIKQISHLALSQQQRLKETMTVVGETATISTNNANAAREMSQGSEQQVRSVEDMANSAGKLADYANQMRVLMGEFRI